MTVGIYALYWEKPDLIYIGQSQDIERRFQEHRNMLRSNTHSNYKVQKTYALYGYPENILIEECEITELNKLEIYWTKEFNSLEVGLNIIEAGQVGYGTNSNASKYSRFKVLKVFYLLYSTAYTYKQIAAKCTVDEHLVADIKNSKTHRWLQEAYPEQYHKMQQREKNTRILKSNPVLISPSNVEIELTTSLEIFCKSHDIVSATGSYFMAGKSLGKVIRGVLSQCQGWKLKVS